MTITGSLRKKWLSLMGNVKNWTIENKLPFAKFSSFGKKYYTIVSNSDNKEETLDAMVGVFNTNRYKKTFEELIPVKIISEPDMDEPKIEDIMEEDGNCKQHNTHNYNQCNQHSHQL